MTSSVANNAAATTSLKVFREFLVPLPDGTIDAERVHSLECYRKWLLSRNAQASDNEARKFHRSLSNHLAGVDGRSPFTKREEEAVLIVLRRKKRWPCFDEEKHLNFGQVGYRSRGFHEKSEFDYQQQQQQHTGSGVQAGVTRSSQAVANKRARLEDPPTPPPSSSTSSLLVIHSDSEDEALDGRDADYVKWMMAQYMDFLHSFSEFTFQVWERMTGILRLVLLGRSPACGISLPETYPHELMQRVEHELGSKDHYIIIYSLFGSDHSKRVLAQNAASFDYFGDLSTISKVSFHASEVPRVLLALLQAVHQPGKRRRLPRFRIMGDKYVEAEFFADPESYYIVSTGCLSQPQHL